MKVGIENYSQFATHLYQTSSKLSMQSRLPMLVTLKMPCFLKTRELNIDAFSIPQISSRPPAFNNRLSSRNRPFCIENRMLTKLIAVSLDLMKFLKQIKYVSTRFNVCHINAFSMSSVLLHGKTLALANYGSIGVNLQLDPGIWPYKLF